MGNLEKGGWAGKIPVPNYDGTTHQAQAGRAGQAGSLIAYIVTYIVSKCLRGIDPVHGTF